MDKKSLEKKMIAWYPFDDSENAGKDNSGKHRDAKAMGARQPEIQDVNGRKAAVFHGGEFGASYFRLPDDILQGVGDETGLTVSAWVCGDPHGSAEIRR